MSNASDRSNENHDVEIISICTVFVFLSLLAVVARFLSRRISHVKLAIDDWLLVVAWLTALAEAMMLAYGTKIAGEGRHISSLSREEIIAFEQGFYATSLLQPTTLAITKISVLILLHRIFITRAFRITAWILGSIVVTWWVAIFFADAFICFPAKSLWNPDVPGHCGNQTLLDVIAPVPWVLTDFAILIAPLPVVKNLQLPRKQKIGICAFFLIGGLTCIVSVVRYRTFFYPINDVTWDIVGASIWSLIEINVTIICAAVIASKPVFVRLLPEKLGSSIRLIWSQSRSSRTGGSSHSQTRRPENPFKNFVQLHDCPPIPANQNCSSHNTRSKKPSDVESAIPAHDIPTEHTFYTSSDTL